MSIFLVTIDFQNLNDFLKNMDYKRNIVSVLNDQNTSLCLCDLCSEPAERCVWLPCCPASLVCRGCAVRHLRTRGRCWVCGDTRASADITSCPEARRITALIRGGRDPSAGDVAWLRDRRRPLETWRKERGQDRSDCDDEEDSGQDNHHVTLSRERTKTDHYRMNLAKEHFNNPEFFDPKENLSFHGFRRFGGTRKKEYDRHKTIPLKSRSFRLRQGSIEPRKMYVKKFLSSESQAKENSYISPQITKMIPVEKVTERVKKPFIDQLKSRFKGNYSIKDFDGMNVQFDKYVEGFMEARQLVALYSGKEDQVGVREDLAEQIVETERHVSQYDRFYGATESLYSAKGGR